MFEKQPIIALDFASLDEVDRFLNRFDEDLYVKVGMELYLQNGPAVIETIKKRNHKIFLDLKLHDIPTTVRKAMQGLASLGIDMINVHAAGGQKMMEEALAGLAAGGETGSRPKLIAVTQLTSTSDRMLKEEQQLQLTMEESVLHYAALAKKAGLDGVVCSPLESKLIEQKLGTEFLKVTPGIRLADGQTHDQIRISTPQEAKRQGSTAIVVGRAITGSTDPVESYRFIKKAWEGNRHETSNC